MSNMGGMDIDMLIEAGGGVDALAARVGVDRATVYDWKRNKALPASRVVRIHEVLGVELAVLLGLTKPPARRRAA